MVEVLDADEIGVAWITSYRTYAKENLKIQKMSGDLVPLDLNAIQLTLDDIIEWIKLQGMLVRIEILKARREGITTEIAGRNYWHCSTKSNRYCFMVTHEPEATDFIFNMHKRFLAHSDPDWKPMVKYNSKKILEFNDPNGSPGGLDSAIRVGTAGKENLGSSQLIHYLHLSEVAKWPEIVAEALLTSLFQCVPNEPDTEIVIESTANGIGGKFYDMYWASGTKIIVGLDENGGIIWKPERDIKADKSNIWVSIFFPWFVFPDYAMAITKWEAEAGRSFVRDEEEIKIVGIYFRGLPDTIVNQKLCWRRSTIENQCQGSKRIFQQEYPASPEEAFLGTGRAAFDPYQCHALLLAAPKPIATYEILPHTGDFISKQDGSGRLWVWQEPVPGRSYVLGADTAEGIEVSSSGGETKYDFSCFDIVDHLTGQQVAQWHGHIDPDLFGRIMFWAGRRYAEAYVGPERNPGGHGSTAINTLIQMGYSNIHVETIPDPPGLPRKRYGWHATTSAIGQAVDNMIKEMRDGSHGIKSSRTLTEFLCYKRDAKGKYGGEVGKHDDLVRSYIITKLLRSQAPLPSMSDRPPQDPFSPLTPTATTTSLPDLSGFM